MVCQAQEDVSCPLQGTMCHTEEEPPPRNNRRIAKRSSWAQACHSQILTFESPWQAGWLQAQLMWPPNSSSAVPVAGVADGAFSSAFPILEQGLKSRWLLGPLLTFGSDQVTAVEG